jgi:hypothetical protein
MKEHLISILITLQKIQDTLFVAYMCLGAQALRHTAAGREIVRSKNLLCVATGLGVLVTAVYLMTLVNYLLYPSYVDHVEATVVSIAWLGMHGHAFYPNWVTDDVYGLVYGPVLYLLHGLFLLIDPTITMSKLLGVVSLLVAFGVIFIVIRQKVANNLTSFLFIASLVMLFVPLGPYAYWSRAEPFLILISALALLVAIRLRPIAAGAILGALAGLAAGFKLHGFIYVAPMAIMTLARVKVPRDRVILAIIGVACAIIFALLPFSLNESSLVGYSQYLNIAGKHSLSLDAFRANLLLALVLFAPAVVIWFWRRPAINPAEFWLLAGLCISVAITVVIGSVSGPYHLLPFVPLCLYAAIVVSDAAEASRIIAIIFLLLLLAYGPGGYVLNSRLMIHYYRNLQTEREKIIELQTYLDSYPDAEIGISDDGHYSDTYYRIISVLQGHALHVDFAAWEDLAYVGVHEKNIIRFIKKCEVPTWILPLGAPFTKLSWYTKLPMLSDNFRRTFSMNYRLIQMGQAYQVWECRSSLERTEQNWTPLSTVSSHVIRPR